MKTIKKKRKIEKQTRRKKTKIARKEIENINKRNVGKNKKGN